MNYFEPPPGRPEGGGANRGSSVVSTHGNTYHTSGSPLTQSPSGALIPNEWYSQTPQANIVKHPGQAFPSHKSEAHVLAVLPSSSNSDGSSNVSELKPRAVVTKAIPPDAVILTPTPVSGNVMPLSVSQLGTTEAVNVVVPSTSVSSSLEPDASIKNSHNDGNISQFVTMSQAQELHSVTISHSPSPVGIPTPTAVSQRIMVNAPSSTISKNPSVTTIDVTGAPQQLTYLVQQAMQTPTPSSSSGPNSCRAVQQSVNDRSIPSNSSNQQANTQMYQLTSGTQSQQSGDQQYANVVVRQRSLMQIPDHVSQAKPVPKQANHITQSAPSQPPQQVPLAPQLQQSSSSKPQPGAQQPQPQRMQQQLQHSHLQSQSQASPQTQTSNQQVQLQVQRPPQHPATIHLIHSVQPHIIQNFQQQTGFQPQVTLQPSQQHPQLQSLQHSQQPPQQSVQFRLLGTSVEDATTAQASSTNPAEVSERWKHYSDVSGNSASQCDGPRNLHDESSPLQHTPNALVQSQVSQDSQIRLIHPSSQHLSSNQYSVAQHQAGLPSGTPRATTPKQKKPRQRQTKKQSQQPQSQQQQSQQQTQQPPTSQQQHPHQQQQLQSQALIQQQAFQQQPQHPQSQLQQSRQSSLQKQQLSQQQTHGMSITNTSNAQPGVVLSPAAQRTYSTTPSSVRPATNATVSMPYHSRVVSVIPQSQHSRSHPNVLTSARPTPSTNVTRPNGNSSNFESRHHSQVPTSTAQFTRLDTSPCVNTTSNAVSSAANVSISHSLPLTSDLSQPDTRNSPVTGPTLSESLGQSSPHFEENSNMGSASSATTPPILSPGSRGTPTPPMATTANVSSKKRNVAPLDNEKLAKVNARYENLINDILIKFREEDANKVDQEMPKETLDNTLLANQESHLPHQNHRYTDYGQPGLTDNQLMPPPPPPSQQMVMHMVTPPSSQVKRVPTGPPAQPNPKTNNNKNKKVQQGLGGKIVPEEANADIVVASPGMNSPGISVHSTENKNGNQKNRKRPPSTSKVGGSGGNAKRRKGVGSAQSSNAATTTMGRKDKAESNSQEFIIYRRMIEELKAKFPPGENFSDLLCSPRYMGSLSLLPPVGGSHIPDDKINRCLNDDTAWMRGHVSKYASGAFSLPAVSVCSTESRNIEDTRDYWFNREEKVKNLSPSSETKVPLGPLLNSPTIPRHLYPGPDTLLEYIPGSPEPLKKRSSCVQLHKSSYDGFATPPLSPRCLDDVSVDEETDAAHDVEMKKEPETSPVSEHKLIEVVLTGRPVSVQDSALQRMDLSPKIDSETGEILLDHTPMASCDSTELLNENINAALDAIQDPNIGPSSIKGASREAGQFKVTVQLNCSQKPYIDQFVEKLTKLFELDPETTKYDVRISDSHSISTDFLGNVREVNRSANQKTVDEVTVPVDTTKLEKIREDHIRVTDLISSRKRPKICRNCRRSLPLFYFIHRRISDLNSGVGHAFKSDPDNEDEFFCDNQCERDFIRRLITHVPPPSANSNVLSSGMPGVINILSSISGSLVGQGEDSTNTVPPQIVDYRHELYVGENSSVVPVILQGPPPKASRSLKRSHSQLQQLPGQQLSQLHSNSSQGSVEPPPQKKRMKGIKWKRWTGADQFPRHPYVPPSTEDIMEKLVSLSGCIKPTAEVKDERMCILCHDGKGDEIEGGPGRLLNIDTDRWIHLNCALWLYDVYETQAGSLCEVQSSLGRAKTTVCTHCNQYGAGLPCYRKNCPTVFHLPCALKTNCMFFTDRGMYCNAHRLMSHPMHLPSLVVARRVYINRNEMNQVARVLQDKDTDDDVFKQESYLEIGEIIDWSVPYRLRVGSMVLHNVGQLLPHQVESGNFHTNRNIYPVGYTIERYYWSPFAPRERCRYICTIRERPADDNDGVGRPEFVVSVSDYSDNKDISCGATCIEAWTPFLNRIADLRKAESLISVYPQHMNGEELFGLTEPHIIRAIESLPGLDILRDYAFRFGGKELIPHMPLAVNPTGCARSEPKLRTYVRQSQPVAPSGSIMVAGGASVLGTSTPSSNGGSRHSLIHNANVGGYSMPGGAGCGGSYGDYTKQYLVTRAQQYRRLKVEARDNVYLSRSRIQGKGLFAAHDLEKNTMVIEYIGEKIRNEVGNRREKLYDAEKRGVYMFRVDDNWIVDATMKGGLARYINHRCTPNCYAEVINVNGEGKIVIVASRKIEKGEELTYDYKFDFEDSSQKIPCNCGSAMCRRWMN